MRAVDTALLTGWALLLLSSIVSMMAVFLGSGSPDLGGLLSVQLAALPCAVLAIVIYFRRITRSRSEINIVRLYWEITPGWLIFAVALAGALALIAELALVLASVYTDEARPWREHVPAICALLSSIALASGAAARGARTVG